MILQNLLSLVSVSLSHDLFWVDEHSWCAVVGNAEYSLTGALLIETATMQSGRAITLQAPPDMAWMSLASLTLLRAWAAIAGLQMRLTLDDGRSFNVVFRHQEKPVLDAKPVTGIASFDPESYWSVTMKLMEI
ncbi:MAG: hypothetical protein K2P84_00065 [Undibacterium sp.]|nr:hypothetical protein [Undibacterium sp.]